MVTITKSEMIFAINHPDMAKEFAEASKKKAESLRKELDSIEEYHFKAEHILYYLPDSIIVDDTPIMVRGNEFGTIVTDEGGFRYFATVYEMHNKREGNYAVSYSASHPFGDNLGRAMGLGKNWTEEQARQAAINWVVHQKITD